MSHRRTVALVVGLFVLLVPMIAFGGEFDDAKSKGLIWLYLGAFGAGMVTSLTPCVYPMIPIIVAVFGARDEGTTRGQAFLLATSYVMGMAALYTALGVIFAMLGKNMGTLLANPYVVVTLVLFFVAFALSMFGAFEIRLPMAWQNKLNQVGGKGYGGAFLMGLVGGLVAAPCVGPFLGGLLTYITTTGDVFVGGSTLFVFALGMGVLFWVIAVFTVSLPRSGGWMEWIKNIGGIGLLVVAVYFLRPLRVGEWAIGDYIDKLVQPTTLYFLGALFTAAIGAAIGAVHLSYHGSSALVRARKTLGIVLMVVGLSAAWFNTMMASRELPWEHDEKVAFERAEAEGKGVMIDFSADWCQPCKKYPLTFAATGVYEEIVDNYVPLEFDISEDNDTNDALWERYELENLPTIIFMDAHGNELARIRGELLGPTSFLEVMNEATGKLESGALRAEPDASEDDDHTAIAADGN